MNYKRMKMCVLRGESLSCILFDSLPFLSTAKNNEKCFLIGVLASFVLLSTVVSEQRDLNATSDDMISTFYTQEEHDSVLLMNLPFAQILTNPCLFQSSYSELSHLTLMVPRATYIEEFFSYVSNHSKIYKEDVQAILRNHTIPVCAEQRISSLPDTPTLEELKEMDMEEALKKIYRSLLVHSAYSFFVHYQVNSSSIRCNDAIQGEESLANKSYALALNQQFLACNVLVGMAYLGYEKEDVTPLLNIMISNLTKCSRRAFLDCQVMHSSQRFLQELQSYAAEDRKKSPTRLHNSLSSSISDFTSTSTTSSSTSSNAFTSSFISTSSTKLTSSTSETSISTTSISAFLTTLCSFRSTPSSERTSD